MSSTRGRIIRAFWSSGQSTAHNSNGFAFVRTAEMALCEHPDVYERLLQILRLHDSMK